MSARLLPPLFAMGAVAIPLIAETGDIELLKVEAVIRQPDGGHRIVTTHFAVDGAAVSAITPASYEAASRNPHVQLIEPAEADAATRGDCLAEDE